MSLCSSSCPPSHPSRLPEFKCRRISEHGPFDLEASQWLCVGRSSPQILSPGSDAVLIRTFLSRPAATKTVSPNSSIELLDSVPGSTAAGSLDDAHVRHHAISILASVPNPTMQQGVPSGSRRRALRPVPTLIVAGGLPVTDTSLGSKI